MTEPRLSTFCYRVTAVHMVAYLIAGTTAQLLFDYEALLSSDALAPLMRPYDSVMVALGPLLQAVNGLAMGLILWPVRSVVLGDRGWLALFLLVAGFSLFAPQAPAPGSFEGWIYTNVPVSSHLIGLPECLLYSGLLAAGVTRWHSHPGRGWSIGFGVALVLIVLMSTLGALDALDMLPEPP